jgi:hypothetical protein
VRISRDVSVRQSGAGDLVVISKVPVALNEPLTLTLTSRAGRVQLDVVVVESVPVVIDGNVRHQLKLQVSA